MEVKPGYKQTDVGVIPEEWEVRKLPEVSWFQEGPGLRNWQFTSSGMKVINVTNLEGGVLNLERTDRHISISEFKRVYQHFAIDATDIVMASSGNSYGKTAVVQEEDLPLVMNTSVIRFKPMKALEFGFLWALLNSSLFKNQIDLMITGGAQPNFGPYHLKRVNVPVPSLPEQRAIAGALSDVDALIGALDQFIAKKRDLTQAAMQQLLTGQTRLPGFHGEWEARSLHEVCQKIQDGTHFSPKLGGNDYLYVTSKNIGFGKFDVSTADKIDAAEHAKIYARCDVKKGDLLLTKDGANTGNAALNPLDEPFSLLSSVALLRFDCRRHLPAYFLYQILSFDGQRQIKDLMSGNAITRLTLVKIRSLRFSVASFEEQTAIAEVLSDMDAELAALEQRRDKTRALKQGMMQELLTGRTRLPLDEGTPCVP